VPAGERWVSVVDDPRDTLGIGPRAGGIAHAVPDAGAAHAVLVLGSRMARLVALGDGVEVDARPSMDPTRSLATLRVHEVPATPVESDVGALRRAATVLVAAEAVGVAERTVEMSVDYGKVRQQFGKPIGSFQAIKHRCADMAVRAEVARSAVIYAAVAVRDGERDADFLVHAAKLLASTAAVTNATDNIQNHGGMGYTWEADAHLYLKRARMLEQTFGTGAAHLDAIAAPWRAA
jgi:acyl-CoA dehydrogenase-like protein